jgi:hypothetical protein
MNAASARGSINGFEASSLHSRRREPPDIFFKNCLILDRNVVYLALNYRYILAVSAITRTLKERTLKDSNKKTTQSFISRTLKFDENPRRYFSQNTARKVTVSQMNGSLTLIKILKTWIVLNNKGEAIMWTEDPPEAEALALTIGKIATKTAIPVEPKSMPRPVRVRARYGKLPKWRQEEIDEAQVHSR